MRVNEIPWELMSVDANVWEELVFKLERKLQLSSSCDRGHKRQKTGLVGGAKETVGKSRGMFFSLSPSGPPPMTGPSST